MALRCLTVSRIKLSRLSSQPRDAAPAAWRPAQAIRLSCRISRHAVAGKEPRPRAAAPKHAPTDANRTTAACARMLPARPAPIRRPNHTECRRRTAESHEARRRLPGRRSPRPPSHRAPPAARSRREADRPEAIRQPRRACGHAVAGRGRDSAGRRTRPPARAATPRPAQGATRIAGADSARTPRLQSEPERAAKARRRGAGDSESAVRRIGATSQGRAAERCGLPPRLRVASRGGSGARI